MTVTQGMIHEDLGMRIDYNENTKVKFWINKYIDRLITEAPEEWKGVIPLLATEHLNTVNDGAKKLEKTQKEVFHMMTAKLLFLSQNV
jgi:hypothetical protein